MPDAHNHHDRGALHSDCPACNLVAAMMSDAGIDPTQVRDYRREPLTQVSDKLSFPAYLGRAQRPHDVHLHFTTTGATDDQLDRSMHIAGEEFSKARVDQDQAEIAERVHRARPSYAAVVRQMGRAGGKTSTMALMQHVYEEHQAIGVEEMLCSVMGLEHVQQLHGTLHALGIGHGGSPEHMVRPVDYTKIDAMVRLEDQKRHSAVVKAARAQRHQLRTRSAAQSREEVIFESARTLQRAIAHADVTIGNRASMSEIAPALIQVGTRKPISISKVSATVGGIGFSGVGTALCRAGDRWDDEVGVRLAVGRAFRALGHNVEASGLMVDRMRSAGRR